MEIRRDSVAATMHRINEAWLRNRLDDLAACVHDEVVMVLPGFSARIQGREPFLDGFRDFCQNATVHEFRESEQHVDVIGHTAVVSFGYEMVYERAAERYRVTGRDLWVFERQGSSWVAVWRTMLELNETAA